MPQLLYNFFISIRGWEDNFSQIGFMLFIIYLFSLILWQIKKRSKKIDLWWKTHIRKPPLWIKKIIMILMIFVALFSYMYCSVCDTSIVERASNHNSTFFHIIVSYSISLIPFFILGVLFATFIGRYAKHNTKWLPKSMFGAAVWASILPICSCAAVPFSYALMATKRIPLRAVITFMFVVPVLNPFVISMSWGILGWQYTVLRIISILTLGMVSGILIERYLGESVKKDGTEDTEEYCSCKGCSASGMDLQGDTFSEAAYGLMMYLSPYMIIGALTGAALTIYLPPFIVGEYLSNGFWGLILSSLLGIPVYLCSGEDILILQPLMQMGLPMGHAISLTLAGNGICLSSITLLYPLFGKKVTYYIISSFFFGSIFIGFIINMLF